MIMKLIICFEVNTFDAQEFSLLVQFISSWQANFLTRAQKAAPQVHCAKRRMLRHYQSSGEKYDSNRLLLQLHAAVACFAATTTTSSLTRRAPQIRFAAAAAAAASNAEAIASKSDQVKLAAGGTV